MRNLVREINKHPDPWVICFVLVGTQKHGDVSIWVHAQAGNVKLVHLIMGLLMKTGPSVCAVASGKRGGQTVLSDNLDYYVAIRHFTESWLLFQNGVLLPLQ